MFVISDWYHSPCLSWDPPKEDDSGCVAPLGRGATPVKVNRTRDSSNTHELHPLNTRKNGMYCGIEFAWRAEKHGKKGRNKGPENDDKSPSSPALS